MHCLEQWSTGGLQFQTQTEAVIAQSGTFCDICVVVMVMMEARSEPIMCFYKQSFNNSLCATAYV